MNPPDQKKWDRYLVAAREGPRREATALAEELAQALARYPREWREQWVDERCRERIDVQAATTPEGLAEFTFPLLRELFVPVLGGRLERQDADAARWLAWVMKPHAGAGTLWDLLPVDARTPAALLRRAERWRPDDARILRALADDGVSWFRYAMHELPSGVLHGIDGANAEECRQMLEELQLLEQRLLKLAWLPKYAAALVFWQRMLDLYRMYLAQHTVRGFEACLSEHFPEWRSARRDAGA